MTPNFDSYEFLQTTNVDIIVGHAGQCLGSESVLDPNSKSFWIRIRIRSPDTETFKNIQNFKTILVNWHIWNLLASNLSTVSSNPQFFYNSKIVIREKKNSDREGKKVGSEYLFRIEAGSGTIETKTDPKPCFFGSCFSARAVQSSLKEAVPSEASTSWTVFNWKR